MRRSSPARRPIDVSSYNSSSNRSHISISARSMTSPGDGDLVHSPPPLSFPAPLYVPKVRLPEREESPRASSASLPFRGSSPAASTTRTSLSSQEYSRTNSPNGRLSHSVSSIGRTASPLGAYSENNDETRSSIIRAFSPTVAIYASPDTDDLARRKGFKNGFRQIIRPFGERVMGKVVVRDSTGASRAWDDFGVRFVELGELAEIDIQRQESEDGASCDRLEELLERYLELSPDGSGNDSSQSSLYYKLFLSRILSAHALTAHETFLHPVACVIAISSGLPAPIDSLRHLYAQTAQGNKTLPGFVNPEYLRYYVLVHDEDKDDIAKSSALFDQMKRHFGLHCHLLRLRSAECSPSDEDSVEMPQVEWLTPSEDLSRLQDRGACVSFAPLESCH